MTTTGSRTALGSALFEVDGKAFRGRDTLVIEDVAGREVATLKEKMLSVATR